MDQPVNIRNMSVIAHGRTTFIIYCYNMQLTPNSRPRQVHPDRLARPARRYYLCW